jgi:hypothetical protein
MSDSPKSTPFASPEEAWFWTMAALIARRDGVRVGGNPGLRPCPDDVVKALDRLYRQNKIGLAHATALRVWGERQVAPDPRQPREAGDARLWREAMQRLEWPLRAAGIVGDRANGCIFGERLIAPDRRAKTTLSKPLACR